MRGLAGGLVAALIAQRFIDAERYWIGIALYLGAIALALISTGSGASRVFSGDRVHVRAAPRPPVQVLLAWAVTAVVVGLVIMRFEITQATTGDWLTHVVAVLAVVVVAAQADLVAAKSGGSGADGAPVVEPRPLAERLNDRPTQVVIGAVASLVLVAAFVRFWNLDGLPFGIWFDEAENAMQGRRIRTDSTYRPVFIPGTFLAPSHLAWLMAVSSGLFGDTIFAARSVTAVMGVLGVLAAFFAVRRLWGVSAGLLVMALFALSRWHITLSRVAMHNIAVPLFGFATLALLLRAMRRGRWLDYAIAGVVAGLGLGFYSAFAASLFAIGLMVVLIATSQKRFLAAIPGLVFAAIVCLVSLGPVVKFALLETDQFLTRQRQTSLFTHLAPGERRGPIIDNIVAYLRMYLDVGDRNGRHNIPGEAMLSSWVAPLAVLGLALALRWIRRPIAAGMIAWFILALVPGVVSVPFEAPNSLRAVGTIMPVLCLAVVPLVLLIRGAAALADTGLPEALLDRLSDPFGKGRELVARPSMAAAGIAMFVVLVVGIGDAGRYFDEWANDGTVWVSHSTAETFAGRLVAENRDTHDVWLVDGLHAEPSTIAFLNPDRSFHEVTTRFAPNDQPPFAFSGNRPVLMLAAVGSRAMFDQLRLVYPSTEITEYSQFPGSGPALLSAEIPPEVLDANRGLVKTEPDGTVIPRHLADGPGEPGSTWAGSLLVPRTDTYSFRVVGTSAASITIDGQPHRLCSGGRNELSTRLGQGPHSLSVMTEESTAALGLEWRGPTGLWGPIDASLLASGTVGTTGLAARHHPGAGFASSSDHLRIDATVDSEIHITRLPRPYSVEWTGELMISVPGEYQFWLSGDDAGTLSINNGQIAQITVDGGESSATLQLEAGPHQLRATYEDTQNFSVFRIQWVPPGGVRKAIPTDLLRPDLSRPGTNQTTMSGLGSC